MWVRIAARYPFAYEPAILACYRRHEGAETARLAAAGRVAADLDAATAIVRRHLPAGLRAAAGAGLRRDEAGRMLDAARDRLAAGDPDGGLDYLREARALDPATRRSPTRRAYLRWALKLKLRGALAGLRRRPLAGPASGP